MTFPLSAKEVFDEAAEIVSLDARRDYLERACASAPALRHEVEALLSAYADAGSFLESPPAPPGDNMDLRPAAERPGTMIGPYELLKQIGEGGMGVVWMAEQTRPVQRKVALKVIKPGMDSKQVVARFEAERQALAVMDHVNIARVFDGGVTEAGLPYFVMELVHGVPITRYCDDNQLTPRERLELFVPVCQAIQHAHQKGIIHRDIKPSNVMVTLSDGRPVPKVIDFGVAKATEQKPGDQTLFTQCGTLVGTLEYMSPEQAEMSALGVDTRSDIFSLGVLLYELLTGSTPLTHERMKQAAHAELLRLIKEEEPPKPSTRLSDSGEGLASISANRQTEPARLTKLLRGDLDWILLKCLEKDRTRRYETANGLAVDILRHLHDEPVTAGAPGAGYRFRKFVKRNRARVIAAGIVAGALVLGVLGTTMGMVWALNEKDRANDERTKTTLAAESEAKARKRAETISEFVTTALKAGDAEWSGYVGGTEGAGYDMTILAAMDNAVKDIDSGRFKDDPETEAQLRTTIGIILRSNGKYDKARPLLEQVLAMRERLAKGDDPIVAHSLINLANLYSNQGQYAQAEPLYTRALAICEKALGPDHPEVALSLNNLANLYRDLGQYAQAEPLYTRALAIVEKALVPDHPDVASNLGNFADLYYDLGQYAQAESLYTRALAIREKAFSPDHPRVAKSLDALARLYKAQGQYARAEPLYTRALAILEKSLGPDHPGVAVPLNHMAALYRAQGHYAQAEPLSTRALAILEKALGPNHPNVASSLGNLADHLHKGLGQFAQAERLSTRALAIREKALGPDHPDVAKSLTQLAELHHSQCQYAQAEPLFTRALAIREKALGPNHPDVANTLNGLAVLYNDQGQYAQAEPLYKRALAIYERALGPDHPDVAISLSNLANHFYNDLGQYAQAEPLYKRALAIHERARGPDHPDVASTLNGLAVFYETQGQYAQAEPLYTRALAIYERALGPDHPDVAKSLSQLAGLYRAQGQYAQAEPLYTRALAIREKALGPDHPDVLTAKSNLAVLYWSQGRLDKSVPLFEEVLKGRGAKLGRPHPATLHTAGNLGVNYKDAGRLAEAIPLLKEAYRASKQYRHLAFAGPALLEAYAKAADPAQPESTARVVVLMQEMLATARGTLPKDSPQLAAQLASFGQTLLTLKAWDEAELLIREALTIREAKAPDDWTTFNTRSLLGGALLGQNKLAEAEPLLLDGYRGMKEREAAIPAVAKVRIPKALERLVRLYEAKGNATEAAAWRSKLEAALAEQEKPDAKEVGR